MRAAGEVKPAVEGGPARGPAKHPDAKPAAAAVARPALGGSRKGGKKARAQVNAAETNGASVERGTMAPSEWKQTK